MEQEIRIPNVLAETRIGKRRFIFTSCHRMPSRSISYHGQPIICYRCGGINIGFIFAMLYQLAALLVGFASMDWIFGLEGELSAISLIHRFIFALLLQIPFIIDGTLQAMIKKYESTNPLRLITGMMGGFGQFYLMFSLGKLVKYVFI